MFVHSRGQRSARSTPVRRCAFTLIELLVVIAIIAILVAILFPVFAQARSKARQAVALSNQKQVAIAFLMYAQDYDERVVPWSTATHLVWQGVYNPSYYETWAYLLQSYVRSWPVYWFAAQPVDPAGIWTGGSAAVAQYQFPGNWDEWPGFGYNSDYLDPNPCSNYPHGAPFDGTLPHPILLSKIVSPSNMVIFTDAKIVGTGGSSTTGSWYPSDSIGSPASAWSPNTCDWGGAGFGAGTEGDTRNYAPPNNTGTGMAATYFNGGTNTSFADGHVKWLTPGQLAAGTNWTKTINTDAIVVTNPAAYIWCYDPNVL